MTSNIVSTILNHFGEGQLYTCSTQIAAMKFIPIRERRLAAYAMFELENMHQERVLAREKEKLKKEMADLEQLRKEQQSAYESELATIKIGFTDTKIQGTSRNLSQGNESLRSSTESVSVCLPTSDTASPDNVTLKSSEIDKLSDDNDSSCVDDCCDKESVTDILPAQVSQKEFDLCTTDLTEKTDFDELDVGPRNDINISPRATRLSSSPSCSNDVVRVQVDPGGNFVARSNDIDIGLEEATGETSTCATDFDLMDPGDQVMMSTFTKDVGFIDLTGMTDVDSIEPGGKDTIVVCMTDVGWMDPGGQDKMPTCVTDVGSIDRGGRRAACMTDVDGIDPGGQCKVPICVTDIGWIDPGGQGTIPACMTDLGWTDPGGQGKIPTCMTDIGWIDLGR